MGDRARPMTIEELALARRSLGTSNWVTACTSIRAARDGLYPCDWKEKVLDWMSPDPEDDDEEVPVPDGPSGAGPSVPDWGASLLEDEDLDGLAKHFEAAKAAAAEGRRERLAALFARPPTPPPPALAPPPSVIGWRKRRVGERTTLPLPLQGKRKARLVCLHAKTRFFKSIPIQRKSDAPEAIEHLIAFFNSVGRPIRWMHCDQANDLRAGGVTPLARKHQIRITTNAAGQSRHNMSEPYNKLMARGARIKLSNNGLHDRRSIWPANACRDVDQQHKARISEQDERAQPQPAPRRVNHASHDSPLEPLFESFEG